VTQDLDARFGFLQHAFSAENAYGTIVSTLQATKKSAVFIPIALPGFLGFAELGAPFAIVHHVGLGQGLFNLLNQFTQLGFCLGQVLAQTLALCHVVLGTGARCIRGMGTHAAAKGQRQKEETEKLASSTDRVAGRNHGF
jgi:hypothetical protein